MLTTCYFYSRDQAPAATACGSGLPAAAPIGADIQSKVLVFAFSLASEIERQLISERTKNSLQRLKDEGKHLGRPHGFTYQKLKSKHNKIMELLDKNVSKAEIARLMGCSWITLHRYIKGCI